MNISEIIDGILQREGGTFTNDPKDSGGPTKWGITQVALSGYLGRSATIAEVRSLTENIARSIYYQRYVEAPGFEAIFDIAPTIADEVIDTGVNAGPAVATVMLQRCLNAFNHQGRDYPDVKADGDCGARTIEALKAFLRIRRTEGLTVLHRALNALQGEFYIGLAERRPKDEEFVYGWLLNRVS